MFRYPGSDAINRLNKKLADTALKGLGWEWVGFWWVLIGLAAVTWAGLPG